MSQTGTYAWRFAFVITELIRGVFCLTECPYTQKYLNNNYYYCSDKYHCCDQDECCKIEDTHFSRLWYFWLGISLLSIAAVALIAVGCKRHYRRKKPRRIHIGAVVAPGSNMAASSHAHVSGNRQDDIRPSSYTDRTVPAVLPPPYSLYPDNPPPPYSLPVLPASDSATTPSVSSPCYLASENAAVN